VIIKLSMEALSGRNEILKFWAFACSGCKWSWSFAASAHTNSEAWGGRPMLEKFKTCGK